MYAVVGILFLAIAGVVSAWTYLQCKRPDPRLWTDRDLPALAVTLAAVTLLWSGMAFFGRFVTDLAKHPVGLPEAALIATSAAVFVVSVMLLRASWRARWTRRRLIRRAGKDAKRLEPRRASAAGAVGR